MIFLVPDENENAFFVVISVRIFHKMRNYNNAHRLFLQTFVSRKLLDEVETKKLYVKAAEKHNG